MGLPHSTYYDVPPSPMARRYDCRDHEGNLR